MDSISDDEEILPNKKAKSALEILQHCPDILNNCREAANLDVLMPIVRTSLSSWNNQENQEESSGYADKLKFSHSGRLSQSLIKHSGKREIIGDQNAANGDIDNTEILKKIGIRKPRRSFKSVGDVRKVDLSPKRVFHDSSNHANVQQVCEKNPLTVTPVKELNKSIFKSLATDEKLILTPAKARKYSICSDVEYDRIYESIKNNEDDDFSIDGVNFTDNFDVIDEILNDKAMARLLDEVNSDNNYTDNDDEDEEQKFVNSSTRRSSSRIKTKKLNRYFDCNDSDLENIIDKTVIEPLPDDVIQKLRNIKVQFEHPVLPQHQIEQGTVRKAPTAEERKQFNEYATLKDGHFTAQENEILENNWKRFCEIHGLNIPQRHFFKCKYQGKCYIECPVERRKFIQFLAHGLPWRTLRAVYLRFKLLYAYKKEVRNKRYTVEEDEKIIKYMESDLPLKKSIILPQLLGRPYTSISQHYAHLKRKRMEKESCDKPKKDVKWTLSLMEKFLKHLMDITISDELIELKDAVIPKIIWLKLQDILNINYRVLKNFWFQQFHAQLFFPRPIYFNEIKIMIIEYLYGRGITHVNELNWSKISQYFNGLTTQFLVKMCPRLHVNASSRDLGNLIEKLYVEKIPILKSQMHDSYLPRLVYSNGKLNVIDNL